MSAAASDADAGALPHRTTDDDYYCHCSCHCCCCYHNNNYDYSYWYTQYQLVGFASEFKVV